MATVTCGLCGKSFDPSWTGARQCTKCSRWFCPGCANPTQCPVCKTYTLKR
jgi:hypothetical protein